nr:unnamed protein product [Callosobruchus analis]
MKGEESDESYIDFSDSGSQWEPNESSEFDSDLNTDNESEENLNPVQNDVINQEDWQEVSCRNLRFDIIFSGNSWCNDHPEEYPQDKTALQPIHVYSQFLDSEILELIVQETNRNAEQQKNKKVHTRFSRIQQWKPTDASEMKKFFGIILYMDNETADTNDRLYKIREIFNKMEQKFSQNFIPGEMIVVDETMIPFKYIPTKRHKYGLKIFKLCDSVGYTFRMSLYTGQSFFDKRTGLVEKIVLDLTDCYLNQGRTIVTDNYYTSPSLARNLLAKETHLLGTLRKNRRGLPPEVMKAKLKKGEITGKEHKDGFVVAKWKDKRDVTFLTTKHGIDMQETGKRNRKGEEVKKPVAILEYNTGKEGVDLSDQMASYFSPLRKTVRWYHKAVFELLLNTAIVNSWIILNILKGKKISIKQFREKTVKALLGVDEQQDLKHEKHTLTQTEERTTDNRKKRNRCIGCYTKLQTQKGRSTAQKSTKKVSTKCNQCNIFLCFTCFTERH